MKKNEQHEMENQRWIKYEPTTHQKVKRKCIASETPAGPDVTCQLSAMNQIRSKGEPTANCKLTKSEPEVKPRWNQYEPQVTPS